MKKIIIALFATLSVNFSYGQVTLTIDSVDFSRTADTIYFGASSVYVYGHNVMHDGINPRIKITATLKNQTGRRIHIFRPGFCKGKSMPVEFVYHNNPYRKYLGWTNSDFGFGVHNLWLKPQESKTIELWTYVSSEVEKYRNYPLYVVEPVEWDWGKKDVTDADFLEWFEAIFPTMQVSIVYGADSNPGRAKRLESNPIVLKEVVATTNLGNLLE